MLFSLTTRWNAGRHETGEAMLDEILALGFDHVELGFDLRAHLVPGVLSRIRTGAVTVDSVHAYCPLPPAVQVPTPEPFTLASPDPRLRSSALHHLENTIRFAAEIGARVVVAHAGNVDMTMLSPKLVELTTLGQQYSEEYDKIRMKLLLAREKAAARQLPHLYAALERLMPLLESTRRILALEILPTWEAIPTELELEKLIGHFNSPWLRGWHDMGHGQIRENLGLSSHVRWIRRLRPILAGLHIHDVLPPAADHLMPPRGKIDFSLFSDVVQGDIVRVLEPNSAATAEEITTGRRIIEKAWNKED